MNEKEAIKALVDGQDKWLKACALHTIGLKEMLDFQEHVEGSTRDKNRLVKESGIFALRKLRLGEDRSE